jgi:transcriptional regulator with XRE-family HTH domain
MVNRIRELLIHLDISPSRLAERMDIPRSTISHILSERNKPSLEFIQKLMEKFPEINIEWLLKGKGNMLGQHKDLFSELDKPGTAARKNADPVLPRENNAEPASVQQESKDLILKGEPVKEKVHQMSQNEQMMHPENQKKRIIKIITFYQDNTFDEYRPAQDKN